MKRILSLIVVIAMCFPHYTAVFAETSQIDMTKFSAAEEYVYANKSSYMTGYTLAKQTFKDAIVFAENSSNVWINDKKYETQYKVLWDDLHFIAPAELLAALAGETVQLSGDAVTIGNLSANVGSKQIIVDGVAYIAKVSVQRIDGVVYIPIEDFAVHKLKKSYSESQKGIAVITNNQMDINASNYQTAVNEMLAYMILDRPNADAIRSAFESNSSTGVHPRLYGAKNRIEELITLAQTDTLLNSRIESLLAYAKKSLNNTFVTDGHSALSSSFEVVEAMYVAYIKTGDSQYPQKAAELALLYADMPTWNHDTYFLDTSFWMLVCAEVYDLFYDALPKETRDKLASAIIDKGLTHSKEHYYGSTSDWPTRTTNWNSVCNGGSMVAATVLLGDGYNDALCLDVLEKSFISVGYQLHEYAPYGGLFESSGYFGYGAQYLVRAIEALNNTFADDFGIMDYPGFMALGEYLFHIESSSGGWAYHDDVPNVAISNMYASWEAYYTGNVDLQKARQVQIERRGYTADFFDVLFYLPTTMPAEIGLPLDKSFKGDTEMTTSRSDWGEEQFFMGIHAGPNNLAHGQWDMGNFIYEAAGVRFATDIGRDDYNLGNDYFDEGGAKSKFYVHRTEGQNLYVINPDNSAGQIWDARSEVEPIEITAQSAAYKVDLTPAYSNQVDEALRGYMLTNDRSVFVVQDEIKTKNVGDEIKWFWHTQAEITPVNKNTLKLTKDGKSVNLKFDSNVKLTIEWGLGEPLTTSPQVDGQLQIGNSVNKVTVTFKSGADKVYFRCTAIPEGHEMSVGNIVPISEWAGTEYYNLDFAQYDGTKKAGDFVSANSPLVHQFGTLSDTYDEAMGHKVLKIEGTDAQYGARLKFESNYTNKDFVEGDKFFVEFNFMAVDKYANNSDLPLLMMDFQNLIRTRRDNADWIELFGTNTMRTQFAVNEWNHLVLEIAPSATEGVATVYINGIAVGSKSYTQFKLDYFNGDTFGSSRFNVGAGYTVLMSKIRSWKSTSSYNAAEAGDEVSIASNNAAVTIGDGVISCATDMTVADFTGKLTLTGTLVAVAADGRVLSNTDNVSSASKVYVRSISGTRVEGYNIDAFAEGVYFDLDFDKYDGGAVDTFLTRRFNGKIESPIRGSKNVIADADKGHNVLKYTSSANAWVGIDMNAKGSFATDVVAGDKVFLETSFKSDDYSGTTKNGIIQFFNTNLIWIEGTTMTLPSGAKTTIKLGEWIHLVLEMTPAETGSGKVITYINGKKVDEFNHSTCTLAYFTNTTWKYNKFQVLGGEYSTLMDNFKAWKSTQSYDAVAEGDTAEITAKNANVVVKDGVVEYMNASTIADINNSLTAENDATIAYFDNSGAEINDLTQPAATAVRMVVRSASCDVVKAYAMVSTVGELGIKLIDGKVIADVRMLDANETPVLYIASYTDETHSKLENVAIVNTTDENGMLSATLGDRDNYTALLWNDEIRPYVPAKNYVMENGVWVER